MVGCVEYFFDVGENDFKYWEKFFGIGQVYFVLIIFVENEENW